MIWFDYVILSLLIMVTAYGSSRLVSYAYFRSKLEHFKTVSRMIRKGE